MTKNAYDPRRDAQFVAEGRLGDVQKQRLLTPQPHSLMPVFIRFVILDVISDPTAVDDAKLTYYQNVLGVQNTHLASVAPRNSIIARRVMGVDSGMSERVMCLYPFFTHISLPAKPGEHVWGMFENPDAKINEIGYWLCKIAQPSFVDDNNYTHADRVFDKSFLPGLSDAFEGTDDPVYEFRNGAVDKDAESGDRYTSGDTASIPKGITQKADTAYEDLLQNTDAAKIAQFEATPRYRKRPQDIAFEGSNNTLIVLGTDRTGPVSDYTTDPNNGKIPKPLDADISKGGAGAIDIVAGRGQTKDTGGTAVDNKLISGGTFQKELGKSKKDRADKEGDPDWVNDRSRVLAAQKTKVDTNLKIDKVVAAHSTNPATPIKDGDGEGAIVVKTDKVRIIARHDVVILVSGATDKDDNGNVKDPGDSIDPTKCASIILRTNGDIVFTPSATGLIRLGGDDADLVPLCTRLNTTPYVKGPGPIVPAKVGVPGIIDTAGGTQGVADGPNGTFPTRIIMK